MHATIRHPPNVITEINNLSGGVLETLVEYSFFRKC